MVVPTCLPPVETTGTQRSGVLGDPCLLTGPRARGPPPRYSSAFTSSPAASVPAPPSWLSVVPAPTVARRRLLRVTTQLATENTPSNTVCWARLDRLASLSTQGLGLYANIWRVFSPKVSGNLARTQCLGVVVTYM